MVSSVLFVTSCVVICLFKALLYCSLYRFVLRVLLYVPIIVLLYYCIIIIIPVFQTRLSFSFICTPKLHTPPCSILFFEGGGSVTDAITLLRN